MYAIIRTGGKQYKVKAGDKLRVEKLEQPLGSSFDINEVLCVGGETVTFGAPFVKGAKVSVVVVQQDRSKKILVFKKKRRKGYRRMQGHRQDFTELFIESITAPNGNTVKADQKAHVIDPAKKVERAERSEDTTTAGDSASAKPAKKKAVKSAAKKVAKKAAPKKTAKSKAQKKKAGAAKATKKKASKK